MISRQKLLETKKEIGKPDSGFGPGAQQAVHMLVDQCLIMHDLLEGGSEQRDWAAARARSDKQVRLALADLNAALTSDSDRPLVKVQKAVYIADCIDQMLTAKLGWAKEWAHYVPRIEEEFGG